MAGEAEADDEEEGTESGESLDSLSVEKVQEEYTLMKDEVKTYPASEYGELITMEGSYKDYSSAVIFCPKEYFKKGEYGTKIISISNDEDGKGIVFLCERKKDGKIVVSPYHN